MNILDTIESVEDLRNIDIHKMNILAAEIREFLIKKVSKTGGHLASNLGVVELTLALHYSFDTPKDQIIWDVGHQSYVHKILTGRKNQFDQLRKMNGISGFPKTNESEFDCFNTGHSSTSISAALGIAKARDINKEEYNVTAIIGDGALTGGMAFEALNDAGRSPTNFIVILNDNEMSIDKNVGGLSSYLSKITTQPIYYKVKEDMNYLLNKIPAIGKGAVRAIDRAKGTIKHLIIPGMIFEELGFHYYGPIDGHNIHELISILKRIKPIKGPILIHVCTQKGKGYNPAVEKPNVFHGISPFDIKTGEILKKGGQSYSQIFGKEMISLAEKDKDVAAITAAMPTSTCLLEYAKKFPNRFFDVGIAEQHAVTFSAGLARKGLKPVFVVYSTFLQRAYDQIVHDVALQNLHVVFAVDRAGIVGEDGETHQGIYDMSFLSHIPNMTILAPCDYEEFRIMMNFAVNMMNGPVAIRYPRGSGEEFLFEHEPLHLGRGELVCRGKDITIVSVGSMMKTAMAVSEKLQSFGVSSDLINSRFVKPIDIELIAKSVKKTKKLVVIEDNAKLGGLGSYISSILLENNIYVRTKHYGFPDEIITHGTKGELFSKYGLDATSITKDILTTMKVKKISLMNIVGR